MAVLLGLRPIQDVAVVGDVPPRVGSRSWGGGGWGGPGGGAIGPTGNRPGRGGSSSGLGGGW